jgi:hypothetical protein
VYYSQAKTVVEEMNCNKKFVGDLVGQVMATSAKL